MGEDLKEATANGSGSGMVRRDEREKKLLVFEVLRMLADHAKEKEKESFRFRSAHTLSLHRKTRPEFIDPNLISGNGIDIGSGSRIHSQILAQIIHQRSIQIARPHCSSF
jgi:hypothetical protein